MCGNVGLCYLEFDWGLIYVIFLTKKKEVWISKALELQYHFPTYLLWFFVSWSGCLFPFPWWKVVSFSKRCIYIIFRIMCHLFDQFSFPWPQLHLFIYQYVDQSVVSKACAGLNGMKIGGEVLKVFPAVPFASTVLMISFFF